MELNTLLDTQVRLKCATGLSDVAKIAGFDSTQQFADALGVSRMSLNDWFSNRRKALDAAAVGALVLEYKNDME